MAKSCLPQFLLFPADQTVSRAQVCSFFFAKLLYLAPDSRSACIFNSFVSQKAILCHTQTSVPTTRLLPSSIEPLQKECSKSSYHSILAIKAVFTVFAMIVYNSDLLTLLTYRPHSSRGMRTQKSSRPVSLQAGLDWSQAPRQAHLVLQAPYITWKSD